MFGKMRFTLRSRPLVFAASSIILAAVAAGCNGAGGSSGFQLDGNGSKGQDSTLLSDGGQAGSGNDGGSEPPAADASTPGDDVATPTPEPETPAPSPTPAAPSDPACSTGRCLRASCEAPSGLTLALGLPTGHIVAMVPVVDYAARNFGFLGVIHSKVYDSSGGERSLSDYEIKKKVAVTYTASSGGEVATFKIAATRASDYIPSLPANRGLAEINTIALEFPMTASQASAINKFYAEYGFPITADPGDTLIKLVFKRPLFLLGPTSANAPIRCSYSWVVE